MASAASSRSRKTYDGERIRESIGVRNGGNGKARDSPPPPAVVAIPEEHVGVSRAHDARVIAVDRIAPDPTQPRKVFDAEALDRLAASLKAKGQLQPIRVRWDSEAKLYRIIAGERRWRAAQIAGLTELTCVVHQGALAGDELLALQLIENCLREDLNPIERARAFRSLMRTRGCGAREAAEFVGVHHATVLRVLTLLKLPPAVRRLIERGSLNGASAVELARVDDSRACAELARQAVAKGWTRAQLREAILRREDTDVGVVRRAPRERLCVPQTVEEQAPATAEAIESSLKMLQSDVENALRGEAQPPPASLPNRGFQRWELLRGGRVLDVVMARDRDEAREKALMLYPRSSSIDVRLAAVKVEELPLAAPPRAVDPITVASRQRREEDEDTRDNGPTLETGETREHVWMIRGSSGVTLVTVNLPDGECDPVPALQEALRRAMAQSGASHPASFPPGSRVRVTRKGHPLRGLTGIVEDRLPEAHGSIWIIVDQPDLPGGLRQPIHPDSLTLIPIKGGSSKSRNRKGGTR